VLFPQCKVTEHRHIAVCMMADNGKFATVERPAEVYYMILLGARSEVSSRAVNWLSPDGPSLIPTNRITSTASAYLEKLATAAASVSNT